MADSKDYMTLSEENGSIHIAEEVIAAIAVGAVREVEGVSGMMTNLGGSVTDLVNNKKNAQNNTVSLYFKGENANMMVYTSCYSDFANAVVPTGKLNLTGIWKRFNNKWELILRSEADIEVAE